MWNGDSYILTKRFPNISSIKNKIIRNYIIKSLEQTFRVNSSTFRFIQMSKPSPERVRVS